MPETFLVVAVLGALLTLNALRPVRHPVLVLPSFAAAWLTNELAPHHLAWQVIATTGFVWAGALDSWAGMLGLAVTLASWAGMVYLIVQSQRVRGVIEASLCQGLGDDYPDRIVPLRAAHHDLRVPWRQLLFPFRRRHPDVVRVKNLPYGPFGRRNRLDVYHHRSRPEGAPVLLQIHGGAWTIGNKDTQGIPLMLHLASRGWVCVAPNYRLSPRSAFPDHLVDLKRAVAWIKDHAAGYGGDPAFIAVSGGSAGGHLAAMVGLTPNDPEYQPGFEDVDTRVQACVPYYGVYDFTNREGIWRKGGLDRMLERAVMKARLADDPAPFEKASPMSRITPEAPPFFVIHGASDTLVPVEEARLFARLLRAASSQPVVYAELPGAQHAFDVFPSIRTAHVIRGVERFADYVYSGYLAAKETR